MLLRGKKNPLKYISMGGDIMTLRSGFLSTEREKNLKETLGFPEVVNRQLYQQKFRRNCHRHTRGWM